MEADAVARSESSLTNFVLTSILNQPSLEAAIIHRVASRLAHPALSADLIAQTFMEAVQDDPGHRPGLSCGHHCGS